MKKFLFLLLFLPSLLFAQTKQVIPVGKNADSIVSINNIYTGVATPILRWRSPIAKYGGSWMWFDAKNFKYDSVSARNDGAVDGKVLWVDNSGVLKFTTSPFIPYIGNTLTFDTTARTLDIGIGNNTAGSTYSSVYGQLSGLPSSGSYNYVWGEDNTISSGSYNTILNGGSFGYGNKILGGSWQTIIGGDADTIYGGGNNNTVVGGEYVSIKNGHNAFATGFVSQVKNAYPWGAAIGSYTYTDGSYAMAMGYNSLSNGQGSVAWGHVQDWNGFTSPPGVPYTLSSGKHAFNLSTNSTSQITGHGALADFSFIAGGVNSHIPSTSKGSVVLGGYGQKARANDSNQVYMPNMNLTKQPLNDDTLSTVLVRDKSTGQIKYRAASSFGGGGGVASVFGRTGAVVADSGDYDISQITGGLSDTLPDGKIWIGDGTDTAFPRTLSGDVTVSNLGVTSVNTINGITKNYYDPTSSIQTQLNAKQATIGLTTTGAIGAASYSNPTLNIPKGYDELGTLGTIKSFTGSQWNVTTDWNTASSGGSFTFGSNKLAMSGTIGTTTYTNYVYISTYVSNLDIYSLEENFKNTSTPSATTYGFSLGVVSLNPSFGLTFKIGMTTSDYGRLYMYNTGGSLMAISDNYFSSGALNDEFNIKITCHKTMMTAVLTCTAGTNIGKSIYLAGSGGGLGATYRFAQYQHGGTYDITSLTYKSDQPIGVEYLFEGNSITKASSPTDINQRYVDFLAKTNKGRFVVHAGSGNSSAEALMTVSEVVTIAPKYVFVFIGTNDAYGAVSTATYASNIASYVSALTSVGYVVGTNIFFISALPRNGVNVVPYNDVLKANYPTAYIDAYHSFEDPAHLTYLNPKYDAGDQVHLNSLGHIDLANIIETAKMSIFTKKDIAEPRKMDLTFTKNLGNLLIIPSQIISPYGVGAYRGLSNINSFKPINNLSNTFYANIYNTSNVTGAFGATAVLGIINKVSTSSTGSYLSLIGCHNEVELNTTTTVPNIVSSYNYVSGFATGSTATNGYGIYAALPKQNAGTLTGTNLYLAYLEDASATSGTNLLTNLSSSTGTWTNRWGLYAAGGNHAFAGNSNVGIGTIVPNARLDVLSTTTQLRIGYDVSNYTTFNTGASGNLTITPISGITILAGGTLAGASTQNVFNSSTIIGAFSNATQIYIGSSTASSLAYYNNGATISGAGKAIEIGTNGVSGSFTTVKLGSNVSGATSTVFAYGVLNVSSYTVATLPACTTGVYSRATVTDALAPTYDAIVVGGGTRVIEVICNGTNWVCH